MVYRILSSITRINKKTWEDFVQAFRERRLRGNQGVFTPKIPEFYDADYFHHKSYEKAIAQEFNYVKISYRQQTGCCVGAFKFLIFRPYVVIGIKADGTQRVHIFECS